ncbi:unnamed protein product [Caenorhabditis brenneri]
MPSSSEDWSDVSGEIADRSSSSKSGDSSSSASPETKKAGLLRRLDAHLLRKHKKKRTTSDELNDSQQSTDTSSTTDNTSSITFESNPNNQTSSEQPQVADVTETSTKSASSSNDNCPTVIKSGVQTMDSVLEEARLPIEAISPAGSEIMSELKNDCQQSYHLKDAKDASNTSPSGSKAPPRGFGTKKVPYSPKLTENDKTKQSIEKYWNYRIALFTKITSSSMKCLREEKDIPSNKPEIDYMELGLTEFVKNPFKTDTHNDPEANNLSDTASDESTEEPNISSSSVGRTDPGAVVTEDFNNTSQTAADSGSFVQDGCITSNEVANWNKSPFQISQPRPEEIGAAIIRIKAFLANPSLVEIEGLDPVNDDVTTLAKKDFQKNSSGSPSNTFPVFGSELINGVPHIPSDTSTWQTAPVKESTSKKLMKKFSVTNWKKKKEVYTPPKSRFSKYFTTTKKGYKLTTQRLKDVFQSNDQNEQMQDTMPTSAIPTPTHATSVAETCSSSSKNPTNSVPLKVEIGNVKDLTKAIPQKYTARKRMQEYMAKQGSLMKTKIKATSPNSMNQVNQASLDKVSEDIPVQASTAPPATIARQIDPKTADTGCLDRISEDKLCGQSSPAKEDEISAARIRMEAYLAKEGGSMDEPIVVTGSNNYCC